MSAKKKLRSGGGRVPAASISAPAGVKTIFHPPHNKPLAPKLLRTATGYRIQGKGGRR